MSLLWSTSPGIQGHIEARPGLSGTSVIWWYIRQSSANSRMVMPRLTCWGRPLMTTKNNNGPSTVAWGTPESTSVAEEEAPFTVTHIWWLHKKDSIQEWMGHYELPMEKKVPWNGAVSMRSRAGSWETLSICITLRHNQGAPADMHANALGILIICRFPLA